MNNNCIACGGNRAHPVTHTGMPVSRDYCSHCTRPDGSMCSYEENLKRMSAMLAHQQGISMEVASNIVGEKMLQLPAWKEHFS